MTAMREVLRRNRALRRLCLALVTSQAGDWFYNVALLAYVYDRTHSATWLGITTAARVLPVVVLGPLGGVLAGRYDRRSLMVVCDLGRAAVMLALLGCAAVSAPLLLLPVLAALATALGAPYPSATAASLPRLVAAEDLPTANALRSVIGPVCIITGPVLGSLVLAIADARVAFALNAVTFVVSAAAVASIHSAAAFRPAPAAGDTAPSVRRELTDGARALLEHRAALRLVGADVLTSFVYGLLTVALLLVSARAGLGAGGYGVLLAAVGAGGVIGAALTGRISASGQSERVVGVALLIVGATLPLMAVMPWLLAVMVWALLGGAGSLMVEIQTETALQTQLDEAVLAQAYGFAFPVSIGGICLGAAVGAPAIAAVGLTATLAGAGLLVAAYALWLLRTGLSSVASRPASAVEPQPVGG
jgi:MFS family permease